MTDKKIYNGFEFFDKLRERLYRDEKIVKAGKGLKLNDVNTLSVDNGDGIAFDDNDKVTVNNGNGIAFDDEGKVTVNGEELLATEEQAGTVYITETPDEWHDKDPDKIALNVVGFNKEKASLVHTINNVKTKLESLLQIKKAGSGLEFYEDEGELSVSINQGLEFDGGEQLCVRVGNGVTFDETDHVTVNTGNGLQFDDEGKLETKIATTETIGSVYLTHNINEASAGTYRETALSQQAGFNFTNTLKLRDIVEVSEGLELTDSTKFGKLLTLNTATDTTLGGVKVSNTIDVEEPADNLVPNVVAIQDGLDQYVFPVFEFIPMTYSNGLIFNKDERNLRIELGDGLKVNDSGGLSVKTTNNLFDQDETAIPTIKAIDDKIDTKYPEYTNNDGIIPTVSAIYPYRNSSFHADSYPAEVNINELQVTLSGGFIFIYANYEYKAPAEGDQVIFHTSTSYFNNIKLITPLSGYNGTCEVNGILTPLRYKYFYEDGGAYQFTAQPSLASDGDTIEFTVMYPVQSVKQ